MEWGHFNADEVAPFQMKSRSRSERFLLSLIGLFSQSFTIPLLMVMNKGLLWGTEWTLWKSSGREWEFILFWAIFLCFAHFSFFLSCSHRYQSSSSGCRPQARTERAWRSHSSVAQPSCDESHNYSGHMDGKCRLSFFIQITTIFRCIALSVSTLF